MNLHYFFGHENNIGDALNAWLWDALLADRATRAENVRLCGIGTILNHTLPTDRPLVIMSSGVGYGPLPVDRAQNWDVAAVRGPLSAHCLNLDRDKAITDGAMLLSLLPGSAPAPRRSGILFIPHYMAVDGAAWPQACAMAGIEFVDPRSDSHAIIAKIRSAELVIANAMHGAILADVLRTPWIAATFDPMSNSFKWNDWCLSMDLRYRPHTLRPSTLYDAVKHRALPRSGDDLPHPARGIAALSRQFQHSNRAAGLGTRLLYRKIASRAVREIAARLDTLEQRFATGPSQRRIAEAAAALHALASAPAMLSDERVFHRQRERMAGALLTMATRYGLALHSGLGL
ncbi:polysaccharide pyruvyl transferase family protein [Novosphingobium sp.]|uniref:polysaccharide pyruvyl transferase family protein n=1 Tax=Novosphingobium sp. TaxID=1874826 RepID=UPI003B51B94D